MKKKVFVDYGEQIFPAEVVDLSGDSCLPNGKRSVSCVSEENASYAWKEIKGGEIFDLEKEGDSLEGELVDVRTEQGKHKSTVYDIKQADGKVKSVFGKTVLDGRMKRVKIGETVKIVYRGLAKSKAGQEYKDFSVFVKDEGQQ